MANVDSLAGQLTQARNELHNLRNKMQAMRAQHQKDILAVKTLLKDGFNPKDTPAALSSNRQATYCQSRHFNKWKPIGHLQTWFHNKNGTPRQGSVSSLSRGVLHIEKDVFNNPEHALEGLQEYSHVWIFFVFDQNGEGMKGRHSKSKVAPPRLNGERIGVFATRSPHRPNPLGLTLAKLETVEGNCLHLSGLDILDGTPVIDIKPYIPEYDSPPLLSPEKASVISKNLSEVDSSRINSQNIGDGSWGKDPLSSQVNTSNAILRQSYPSEQISQLERKRCITGEHNDCEIEREGAGVRKNTVNRITITEKEGDTEVPLRLAANAVHSSDFSSDMSPSTEVKTADWLKTPPLPALAVIFNPLAEQEIQLFSVDPVDEAYRLNYLKSNEELKLAIAAILQEDPRSSYRRKKCSSSLYYFTVDTTHITAWFDENVAEVLRVRPLINSENVV